MDDYEQVLKPIYFSKKDILKGVSQIKTEYNENTSQLTKYPIKNSSQKKYANLGKKNLTYQNFYDYIYDYNNINEHQIKMPNHLKIKQKYHLLLDKNYSSNMSKVPTKNKITPLLITGINTPNNNNYNKFEKLFSTSKNSIENSELKTKSSSKRFIQSNLFNFNSSDKNELIFPSEISKSKIHFNSYVEKYTKNENQDEGLKAFVQKSKIIMKTKIIQQLLIDKLTYKNDLQKEAFIDLNKKEKQLYKNIQLLDLFEKDYIHYLRELKQEEAQETRIYQYLKEKKLDLENEILKLYKKIDKMKLELLKYDNIKQFFTFSQSGLENLSNKKKSYNEIKREDNKEKENKDKTNQINIKRNLEQGQINLFRNTLLFSLNKSLLSIRHNSPNKFRQKKTLNKYNSLKMDYNITTENNNNIKNKNPEKTPSNKSKDGINRRKSKKKSNISSVHQKQYEHMFTNVEKTILENIRVNDLQKKEIFEQKKNLEEIITFSMSKNQYTQELIIRKEKLLRNLKEDNIGLKLKFNQVSKMDFINDFSVDNLEQKMLCMVINLQTKINVQEITKTKNLLSMLKFRPQDFLERFRLPKVIFLIKTIELLISYLISKKNEYLCDPKLKDSLKKFLFKLENDKKIRMNILNKKILKKGIDDRIKRALEKETKIRFYSFRKFDLTNYKNKKNKLLEEKINNKTTNDNQYEQWILYDQN